MVKVRGIEFQDNMNNAMGLQFTNLSHRWGFQCAKLALLPGREDRAHSLYGKVRRTVAAHHHFHAFARHISMRQRMWCRAHPSLMKCRCRISLAPALWCPMPKKKWESITADDLEKACGHAHPSA